MSRGGIPSPARSVRERRCMLASAHNAADSKRAQRYRKIRENEASGSQLPGAEPLSILLVHGETAPEGITTILRFYCLSTKYLVPESHV